MITVIDYGRGNLFSIGRALSVIGAPFNVSSDPDEIGRADCLLLPGVGAFGDAMSGLEERGLVAPIHQTVERGAPMLGICVGMQLLTGSSDEFDAGHGLGIIPGKTRKLPAWRGEAGDVRIPNVGWRRLETRPGGRLESQLGPDDLFYFVHSYAPVTDDPAHTDASIAVNGGEVAAVIRKDNVIGYQFHPEKSADSGLRMLKGFAEFAGIRLAS